MGPVPLALLLVLFSLMLFSPVTDAQLPCSYRANGCSIPGNLPFFYKRTFKPACNMHDQCYNCGSSHQYRISRRSCDNKFHRNMQRICRRIGLLRRISCFKYALVYFTAVRVGRKSLYLRKPEKHCPLVSHCLK
ncbi:uncharacterized protein LOC134268032 [Saccostrea cucullata]|uniref:uncharacterized protein LOC134268032 n=1 Tax=Saccostrea cuccullata TaxID=36930 RepID=UPI002ED2C1AD